MERFVLAPGLPARDAAAHEPLLAVVLHDVAPQTWHACRRVLQCLHSVDASLPVTYLVVPRYHGDVDDEESVDASAVAHSDGQRRLREAPHHEHPRASAARPMIEALDRALAQGSELALHGLTHRDDGRPAGRIDRLRRRWYTAGEGEFAALDEDDAQHRLQLGRAWFAAHRWPLHGFVPPAWLMSEAAARAVDQGGFEYTCSLSRVVALPGLGPDGRWQPRASVHSQSLVYSSRSGWRRAASCAWNPAVAWAERGGPLLRFELHPSDADHRGVRRSWMRLLEQALRERRAVTLREAAQALRQGPGASEASAPWLEPMPPSRHGGPATAHAPLHRAALPTFGPVR